MSVLFTEKQTGERAFVELIFTLLEWGTLNPIEIISVHQRTCYDVRSKSDVPPMYIHTFGISLCLWIKILLTMYAHGVRRLLCLVCYLLFGVPYTTRFAYCDAPNSISKGAGVSGMW